MYAYVYMYSVTLYGDLGKSGHKTTGNLECLLISLKSRCKRSGHIQSWYLARISRSEMRMVTTCPRTKSPHESQLFYGSTTEFNGSDAAEKTTDP